VIACPDFSNGKQHAAKELGNLLKGAQRGGKPCG
jgi:hypothetical protein